MKSIATKFILVLLAAAALLTLLGAACGMFLVAALDIRDQSPTEMQYEYLQSYAYSAACSEAGNYATATFGDLPDGVSSRVYDSGTLPSGVTVLNFSIFENGMAVASGGSEAEKNAVVQSYSFTVTPYYLVAVPNGAEAPAGSLQAGPHYYSNSGGYTLYEYHDRTFSVELTLQVVEAESILSVLQWLVTCHAYLPFALLGSLLVLAVCIVWLCWAAGKASNTADIRPRALNALPLDLYTAVVAIGGLGGIYLLHYLCDVLLYSTFHLYLVLAAVLLAFVLCLAVVGLIFAFAAQVKAGGRFWWRRSITGFLCIRIWRATKWLVRGARSYMRSLSTIWQWLLTAVLMAFVPFVLMLLIMRGRSYFLLPFFGALLLDAAIVLYGGWCFGKVLRGAADMAQGDLDTKIDTRYLLGSFRDCAVQLNSLSGAALLAAREKMRSERMKTELITNVSHDIKTPLTSLINYVDLMQKPHSEQEGAQYLEVLARQSARLKKLIDDLMEMSKASSGNITAQIVRLDAVETVFQALGEFSDKLAARELTPVFRQPEGAVYMRADGRLAWRVMSNLLSNAVKYAMPGTRLYVDIAQLDSKVLISFKNISQQALNIRAEELMERFVRGDASRNTEGSGLGLNIAESLMEVQDGTMQVLVDGDLFKVTLYFPADNG